MQTKDEFMRDAGRITDVSVPVHGDQFDPEIAWQHYSANPEAWADGGALFPAEAGEPTPAYGMFLEDGPWWVPAREEEV